MKQKRVLSMLLLLSLLFALTAPAALAEEEEREPLHITTEEDLRQLAADCRMDSYSRGLQVVLDNDIDLSGEGLHPIPTFGGSFDGCGHTIRNLRLVTDGSHQGFFRYIQETGEIRNLNLTGAVSPQNGKCQLGGLAGVNYGTISDCSFSGSVSGRNSVGGLVGENYGTVSNCTVSGKLDGKRWTGGVAGYNEGWISDCSSDAQVNTSITEDGLQLEDLSLSLGNLELANAEDENVVSDSGGIVGFSKGVVQNCINRGAVGYPHYGYNVGGIAGRQSGYLTSCENYGEVQGKKDVGGIVGQMEPFLFLKDSANLAEELALLTSLMNQASGTLSDMSDEMHDAVDSTEAEGGSALAERKGEGTIRRVEEAEAEEPTGSGGRIAPAEGGSISGGSGGGDETIQEGHDYIGEHTDLNTGNVELPEGYADELSQMAGILSSGTGELGEELTAVNNQFGRVMMLLANALNGAANRQFFEDVSDQLAEDDVEGRISHCVNHGSIDGDRNVGGISGDMGIEYEFDLEGSLAQAVGIEGIISNTYETKCVCSDNVNQGSVSGKKEDVGGITGKEETGSILRCENYGSVSAADGQYVGGVAGCSYSIIRLCYAMCDLSGTEYVGGIAGYGTTITDCASMVGMEDVTACGGAVAGWADMSGENVMGNSFVHETLGAVDGISYDEKAYPVSYETLLEREDLPQQFRTLRIQFVADGVPVESVEFEYGGSIQADQIPEVPEKEGFTGAWPEYDFSRLYFSAVLEAVYTPRQGALAAKNTREDSPMSIVLIEGDFDNSTQLSLHEYAGDDPVTDGGIVREKWVAKLSFLEKGQSYSLRYLPPEVKRGHRIQIYVWEDGVWSPVNTDSVGRYLSFDCSKDTVVFCAVETAKIPERTYVVLGGAGAAALGIGLAALHVRKKRKPAVTQNGEK